MAIAKQAILDYRTTGTEGSTARVVQLSEAIAAQEARARRLAPVLREAGAQQGAMAAISQSAAAKITSLTNQIGPLGAGLGFISRQLPLATTNLIRFSAANERASLMSRALNTTLLGGASASLAMSVAAVAMANDAIRAGDTYATLHARIRTFSEGMVQAAQMEKALYANAREARTSVEGQVTLYTRLAPAVRDYGKSQEDALAITKLVSKAQAIQGADIREQLASTIQFSQAVASGVLRGDELRSMLESSPQLLRYMAANLELNGKIGVSFSQLRNLGAAGALTTQRILDALLRAGPQIEKDFINAPKTAQQGWQVLTDTLTRAVGQLAQTSGAQQGVVTWLGHLADLADAFRQKMILDPHALDPIKEAGDFMGQALGLLGDFGRAGAENFDLIVKAGEAVIALKLGEVFASWFATGAEKLRAFQGSLAAFKAQAAFQAGATMTPVAASAAQGLRSSSVAMDLRATELAAQAEIKLAQATAARTAADRAAVQAALAKASVGAGSAAAAEAEAAAVALDTAATRAEEQAKKAAAAATTAAAAASTRNAIANEAEAAVTINVTRAVVAKNVAMSLANGLYAALGGAIGIATLAIGGLIYAVWKAEDAYKAQVRAQHDALVVSDQMHSITQQLTAATWAQVPALLAQAQAIRETASAKRLKAEADLKEAQAQRSATVKAREALPPTSMEEAAAYALQEWWANRRIADIKANLDASNKDQAKVSLEHANDVLIAQTSEASNIQRQLSSGKDLAGRDLSSADKGQLDARRQALFTTGQNQVDSYDTAIRQQKAAIDQEKDGVKKKALVDQLTLYSAAFQTATELVSTADKTGVPSLPSAKPKKVGVPGGVNQAFTELLQQQYFPTAGKNDYSLKKGVITDRNGGVFTARSEDEAAAAAKYVKQILAINQATDTQIAKTGKSRDALREAASAMLAHEVATSKASAAVDKWDDIQAEMTGKSRAVVKAQREVNDLIEAGAKITDDAAQKYLAYIEAREKARRMQQALQIAEPAARKAYDLATAGSYTPTDARGVVDIDAATRQLEAKRQAILEESERRIRAELEKQREAEGLTQEQYEQRLADAIAANRIAVEGVLQDRLLEIQKDRLNKSRDYAEQRFGEIAGAFGDALDSLRPDTGNKLIDSLLSQAWRELVSNPLRNAIVNYLRETFTPQVGAVGGGGGGAGGFLTSIASAFFGGQFGGGGGSSGYVSNLGSVNLNSYSSPSLSNSFGLGSYKLNLSGHRSGGWVRGPGGPRGDKIPANLSDEEFVVNAYAARKNAALLEQINAGGTPGFANGGWSSGGAPAGALASSRNGSRPSIQVNNYMGGQAKVEASEAPDGGMKIDIVETLDQHASGYARSGKLMRDLRRSPMGPTRRG